MRLHVKKNQTLRSCLLNALKPCHTQLSIANLILRQWKMETTALSIFLMRTNNDMVALRKYMYPKLRASGIYPSHWAVTRQWGTLNWPQQCKALVYMPDVNVFNYYYVVIWPTSPHTHTHTHRPSLFSPFSRDMHIGVVSQLTAHCICTWPKPLKFVHSGVGQFSV